MNKKIQILYFFIILLFCSSVNARENNDDNPAQLKQLNRIQAGIIQDKRRKELELQEELKKKEQELEESYNINGSNASNNSNSSLNTGQGTNSSNNIAPEQYIGSNNRNTQDNASSKINSKVYVNDDKNLDIIKVPNTIDSVQKTNQSQSDIITGNSNQQELLGDNKQSDSQINQLDSDGEPLEIRENTLKFELLQSDIEEAEAKLLELQSRENDLNNAYMDKKLAFEELEQLQSQLPKQQEIKDNSLNQLQNQEAQKNVAGLQGGVEAQKKLLDDLQPKEQEVADLTAALAQEKQAKNDALAEQAKLAEEVKSNALVQKQLKIQLEETEKNTQNQLTKLSATKNLEYNKLNTDLQAKLAEDKKEYERVQKELVEEQNKFKEENERLQASKTELEKNVAALNAEKEKTIKELEAKMADLTKSHAEQAVLAKAREQKIVDLTKANNEALKVAQDNHVLAQKQFADDKKQLEERIVVLDQEREKKAKELVEKEQVVTALTKETQAKDVELKRVQDKLNETIAAHALDKQNLEKENELAVEKFAKAENDIATLMKQKDELDVMVKARDDAIAASTQQAKDV